MLRRDFQADLMYGEKTLQMGGIWASSRFFDLFSFDVIKGNRQFMLSEPYSIVLTERAAKKLFDDADPVGKHIKVNEEENYLVTGLIADPPVNSHLQFEVIPSFATYELKEQKQENSRLFNWTAVWMNLVVRFLSSF